MPRYRPTGSSLTQELDAALTTELRERADAAVERHRLSFADVNPYGSRSPHSWFLDRAAVVQVGGDHRAQERLDRHRSWAEKQQRAVSTTTLSFIQGVLPPWVAEAVSHGVRSGAPLASALLRLDLPPTGDAAFWAKVTTGATVTNQTAENAALTASTDAVVDSAEDPLRTVAAYLDYSAQGSERSGGWFDRVMGDELGRALGARLESQIWSGSGSGGQLTGLVTMSGGSDDTVEGQTLANQTASIWEVYAEVAQALGEVPDVIAMGSRRAGGLGSLAAATAQDFEKLFPPSVRERIVISPAAPTNLGAGSNEDWIVLLNRDAIPLVRDPEPVVEVHRQQASAGTALNFRMVIYLYCALGTSRRPEGVGTVRGLTAPTY